MAKAKELFCEHCGTSFVQQAMKAMLIDLGAHTNIDPVYCFDSPTEEHSFVRAGDLADIIEPKLNEILGNE